MVAAVSTGDDGLSLLQKVEAELKALADAEARAEATLKKLEEDRKNAFGEQIFSVTGLCTTLTSDTR